MAQVQLSDEWSAINWAKVERNVFRLQKRIYQASSRNSVDIVWKLQRLLIASYDARLLAVRRVTQDNQGKKTAGIDGVKELNPKQRMQLVHNLSLSDKSKPTRRVWIPKSNGKEMRPLGIPTMMERAKQALVKLSLEPQWEAKFEGNSFGFRPGRSCHDAVQAIWNYLNKHPKWVLDADIAKCFDKIDHQPLLEKVNTYPSLRRQLLAWLKSGVIDFSQWAKRKGFSSTNEGTPQGGVISPLLANIALHGLQQILEDYISNRSLTNKDGKPLYGSRDKIQSLGVIRYADDFVVIHHDRQVILECQDVIKNWLTTYGLELKESKTQIVNSSDGFDFLGFNFRHYQTSKYKGAKATNGKLQSEVLHIKPSSISIKKHQDKLAEVVDSLKSSKQSDLIERLNPIIKGWCNYYKTVMSSETFSKIDHLFFDKLWSWAKRRHPRKTSQWIKNKYWQKGAPGHNGDNWVFKSLESNKEVYMWKHYWTNIERFVKVQNTKSPYDGDLIYWSSRLGRNPELNTREATLLKMQKGKCIYCHHYFQLEDKWEVDHIIPKSMKGGDSYKNLQLLHKHCHDKKTAIDLVEIQKFKTERSTHEKS